MMQLLAKESEEEGTEEKDHEDIVTQMNDSVTSVVEDPEVEYPKIPRIVNKIDSSGYLDLSRE